MKILRFSVFLVCTLLISSSVYAINFSAEQIYDSVAVVYTDSGVGSGFSIKENVIVTNAHVVGKNKIVAVNFYDGTTTRGDVIKADLDKDLALIEVDKTLTPLKINGEKISIGQEVYAIGAPKDMPYTMTKGIISALERKLGNNTYIQIDASVNAGNSGGPLVDENGELIGVITLKANNAEGIGFAISAPEIVEFVNEAKSDDELSIESSENDVNDEILRLSKENEILKIAVMVLSVLLVVLLLILLKVNAKEKAKDETDFEIEIEE